MLMLRQYAADLDVKDSKALSVGGSALAMPELSTKPTAEMSRQENNGMAGSRASTAVGGSPAAAGGDTLALGAQANEEDRSRKSLGTAEVGRLEKETAAGKGKSLDLEEAKKPAVKRKSSTAVSKKVSKANPLAESAALLRVAQDPESTGAAKTVKAAKAAPSQKVSAKKSSKKGSAKKGGSPSGDSVKPNAAENEPVAVRLLMLTMPNL